MDKKANSHSEFLFNGDLLNSKRSQAQIITVVLIILLVLAAIVIVWQVIRSTVEESTAEITGGAECIQVDLDVTNVTASDVTVQRKAGGDSAGVGVKVIVAGSAQENGGTGGLTELASETINFDTGTTLSTGEKVEVGAILPDGTICEISGEKTL